MTYKSWFLEHGNKHKTIILKLKAKGFSKDQIIEYFEFDNMVKLEPDFCYLYPDNKKCHDMEYLNCYQCACPLFRFNSVGIEKVGEKTVFSYCEVDSKFGEQGEFGDAIHQDCSRCVIPHGKKYVERHYNEDWFAIMSDCDIE